MQLNIKCVSQSGQENAIIECNSKQKIIMAACSPPALTGIWTSETLTPFTTVMATTK